ncbi:MAG: hypothetical protein GXO14_05970 [Thermococci archaeon]|nr:hypothetical protein [Thermococci archaeon]
MVMASDDMKLKYIMQQLKRVFKDVPFLEVEEESHSDSPSSAVAVKDTGEFLDVCNKLRLLVEYSFHRGQRTVRFVASYGNRLFVHELDIDSLYSKVERLVEMAESRV